MNASRNPTTPSSSVGGGRRRLHFFALREGWKNEVGASVSPPASEQQMSRAILTEHAGAKNGGGYWGRRAEAKAIAKRLRRASGKWMIRNDPDNRR